MSDRRLLKDFAGRRNPRSGKTEKPSRSRRNL